MELYALDGDFEEDSLVDFEVPGGSAWHNALVPLLPGSVKVMPVCQFSKQNQLIPEIIVDVLAVVFVMVVFEVRVVTAANVGVLADGQHNYFQIPSLSAYRWTIERCGSNS